MGIEREDRRKARQQKKEEKEAKKKAREDAKLADMGDNDMLFADTTDATASKKSSSKKDKKDKKDKKHKKDKREKKTDHESGGADLVDGDLLGSDLLMGGNSTAGAPAMSSSGGMADLLDSMDLGASIQSAAPGEAPLIEFTAPVEKKKKKKKSKEAAAGDDRSAGADVCSRISSSGATKDMYEEALLGSGCECLANCKIKMAQEKIQSAIEQIAAHLQVEMVDCVPGAVSFFGKVDGVHPIAVLIKARSSGVSIEVRSYNQDFVSAVLEEAKVCASKI